MRSTTARVVWISVVLVASAVCAVRASACLGDCNGDGEVTIDEVLRGVNIALAAADLAVCPVFDRDQDGAVTVDEIVAGVNAALLGCPSTPTPTATSTPQINHAPQLTPVAVYRAYAGFPVAAALPVADPDGDPIVCEALALPATAQLTGNPGTVQWTPSLDQVGPAYVSFRCRDGGNPPMSVDGVFPFAVQPVDGCSTPVCDPAVGCSAEIAGLDAPCCTGTLPRYDEPDAECPGGRVLQVSESLDSGEFVALENCDLKRVRVSFQSSAEVRLRLRARCITLRGWPRIRARLESKVRVPIFDQEYYIAFTAQDGGWVESPVVAVPVDPPRPFFDIEGSEANLTVTLTDAQNDVVSTAVRLRLTFTPVPTPAAAP